MGVFGKTLEKLHLKPKVKHRQGVEYESHEVQPEEDPDYDKVKDPQLIIGDAPPKPMLGSQPFKSNMTYRITTERPQDPEIPEGDGAAAPANIPGQGHAPEARLEVPGKAHQEQAAGRHDFTAENQKPSPEEKEGDPTKQGAPTSGAAPVKQAKPAAVIVPDIQGHDGILFEGGKLLTWAAIGYGVFHILFLLWMRPSILDFIFWVAVGGGIGAAGAYGFYQTKHFKRQLNAGLNVTPGRKGLAEMVGKVPSWVQFKEKERVEFLNKAMLEMWPFYDKAACAMIKQTVEPLMNDYKPPGLIKNIYFKHLTFGDAPIKIDNVWVEDEGEEHVMLEIGFRWDGEGVNIAVAIELFAGGDAARMVPKVTDLQCSGVIRVLLAPLCPEIPCFGAAVVALRKPPLLHFKLDFGKALGSAYTAKAIRLWLDPFLRETLAQLIVWPNRLVYPILPESVTGPIDFLQLRHVGILQVSVLEGRNMRKMDTIGKSDPWVELYTQPTHKEKTTHKKNTLDPKWSNEDFWMLVQEPKTQMLRVQVFDRDNINLKELLNINLMKGIRESVGAAEFMARCAVDIKNIAIREGESLEDWYDLGRGDWSNDEGCGRGEGELLLRCKYWSFETIYSKPRQSNLGGLLVRLMKAQDLPPADNNGKSDPYVIFKIDGREQRSTIKPQCLEATWDEKFEWMKVQSDDVLTVEVYDHDAFTEDEMMGYLEVRMEEVQRFERCQSLRTYFMGEVPGISMPAARQS
ncbi:hypothetical protein WJX84_002145 [Apatococcus fuscideae]|uniref:Uncharacterized protein n=1 Tax=Apatococcus fuscideae TaxID=2026836 RepID=A0AAW1TDV7_9CHLO